MPLTISTALPDAGSWSGSSIKAPTMSLAEVKAGEMIEGLMYERVAAVISALSYLSSSYISPEHLKSIYCNLSSLNTLSILEG